MKRREFLKAAMVTIGGAALAKLARGSVDADYAMTVLGKVPAKEMGVTLPHEHVMADFIGAEKTSKDRYDADEVFEVVLPHLKRAREAGVETLAECTPAYLGRDAAICKRLSEASGVKILTNTGYYGAAGRKFVPAHAYEETAEQLAKRWIREWEEGIEGTGIRPGFIKTGTDAGPLLEINQKLIRAAGMTHLATGLTIASHTGNGIAAMEQLAILKELGVDPSAFIWVHGQSEADRNLHARAAEGGAWVEFDGVRPNPNSIAQHLELVKAMKERRLLGRVLLSHDAGWYNVGQPKGGNFQPYDALPTRFVPALKEAGLSDEEIRRLTVENPREGFTVRVRRAGSPSPV